MPNPRSEWRVRHLRARLADRDGWRCYRCKGPIDRRLRYPHPMSVSLEHIVPLAHGGAPYDERNCTVSHLTHNQAAGARARRPPHSPPLHTSEDW
jgi:hypothetical protein